MMVSALLCSHWQVLLHEQACASHVRLLEPARNTVCSVRHEELTSVVYAYSCTMAAAQRVGRR
jgi:hypothetical protein